MPNAPAKIDEKPAPQPLSAAARAAARLEIEQVRFLQFSALTARFRNSPLGFSPRWAFLAPTYQVQDKRLCVTTTFLMRILPVEEVSSEQLPAFDLRWTAELVYRISDEGDIDDAALDEFARVNAPFNAWPYWREFVQSAFCRLNLPVSPLPLFRVPDASRLTVDEQTFGKP